MTQIERGRKSQISGCGWLALVACVITTSPMYGQSVAQLAQHAPDGRIRMMFAARPGVCGNGSNISTGRSDSEDWEWDCETGPVHVLLTKSGGEITRVQTFVGGRWRVPTQPTTDLGTVPAAEAADYLAELAEHGDESVARRAIMPATLADSAMVWPALLRVAGDDSRPRRVRRAALQQVAMVAGDAVVDSNRSQLVDDPEREARERAVFSVSQLPREEGIPLLLEIARTHRDPEIRRKAMFWLGQKDDPRAIELFEEVLRGRR